MNKDYLIDCERSRLEKIASFRLPYAFKTVGLVLIFCSISLMFYRAFVMDGDTEWFRLILRKSLLIGMLVISISRDKIEDEMTIALRAQSYAIAFVIGVVYALVMPYVEYGVSNVVHSGGEVYKDLGDFQVLLFMLMIQLMFYYVLKRNR